MEYYKNKIMKVENARKNIDTFLSGELKQLVEQEDDYKYDHKEACFVLIAREIQMLKETLIK